MHVLLTFQYMQRLKKGKKHENDINVKPKTEKAKIQLYTVKVKLHLF